MMDKVQSLRVFFHEMAGDFPVRARFANRVLDAIEEHRLPHDTVFTLSEVFAQADLNALAQDLHQNSDPLFSDAVITPADVNASLGEKAMLIGHLTMMWLAASKDAILDAQLLFIDDKGGRYPVMYEEFEAINNGGSFMHPKSGDLIDNPADHMHVGFQLSEPL